MTEAESAQLQALLVKASHHWTTLRMDDEMLERARRPFPLEPVRTLDAIHLATCLLAQSLVTDVRLLSLDNRIRGSARSLGISLLPE